MPILPRRRSRCLAKLGLSASRKAGLISAFPRAVPIAPKHLRPRGTRTGTRNIRTSAVHRVLEGLAGRETRTPRRLDLDRLAGARVATLAGGALDDAEMTEPHDLDLTALLERRGDGVEGRVDGGRRGCLGHAGLSGHRCDQLVLGHRESPFLAFAPNQ